MCTIPPKPGDITLSTYSVSPFSLLPSVCFQVMENEIQKLRQDLLDHAEMIEEQRKSVAVLKRDKEELVSRVACYLSSSHYESAELDPYPHD